MPCLDPPFCFTCQVFLMIRTLPRDRPHHQGQSSGGPHTQDIDKQGGTPTSHCGDSPWFQKKTHGVQRSEGGFQAPGRRFEALSTGPRVGGWGRGGCCFPHQPWMGTAVLGGGEGLGHGAGGGACSRFPSWRVLPETDCLGLGCLVPPWVADTRAGHPVVL